MALFQFLKLSFRKWDSIGSQPTIASFGACTVRSLSPQQSRSLLDNTFGFTGTGFTDKASVVEKDSSPTVVNNVYNFKSRIQPSL